MDKRLHYFDGQFLHAVDFNAEQSYHVDRQRRHNQYLHTPGIAHGLEVTADEGASVVEVAPGTAVDRAGRQLVLLETTSVELTDAVNGKAVLLVVSYR